MSPCAGNWITDVQNLSLSTGKQLLHSVYSKALSAYLSLSENQFKPALSLCKFLTGAVLLRTHHASVTEWFPSLYWTWWSSDLSLGIFVFLPHNSRLERHAEPGTKGFSCRQKGKTVGSTLKGLREHDWENKRQLLDICRDSAQRTIQGGVHITQIHIQVWNHCHLYSITNVMFVPKWGWFKRHRC